MRNIKRLSTTGVVKMRNSLEWTAHYSVESNGVQSLRIRIKRDAYDFQSYAVVEIWSQHNQCWSQIAAIPYPHLATLDCSYVDRDEDHVDRLFLVDADDLLALAGEIL